MTVNWAAEQGVNYLILGTGTVACLLLWVSAKVELRNCAVNMNKLRRDTEAALQELESRISQAAARPTQVELPPPTPVAFSARSVNLTKRTQVLRMARRGESVPSIAAALEVPQGEVELVLKLDQLLEAR